MTEVSDEEELVGKSRFVVHRCQNVELLAVCLVHGCYSLKTDLRKVNVDNL